MKSGLMVTIAATAASSLSGVAFAQCAAVDPVVVPQIRVDPLDAAGPAELVQPVILTFRRTDLSVAPLTIVTGPLSSSVRKSWDFTRFS